MDKQKDFMRSESKKEEVKTDQEFFTINYKFMFSDLRDYFLKREC